MRHALAHAIIHSHECSVRFHARFDRPRQSLHASKEWSDLIARKIGQSLAVFFWNDQTMAGKNRAMVEKSERVLVLKDNSGGNAASHDFAKQAGRSGHLINTGFSPMDLGR
jgi:hypothetical protein